MASTYNLANAPAFALVEYPGPVRSTNKALASLGGLATVSNALLQPEQQQSDAISRQPPELNLQLSNLHNCFHHPVPATIANTANVVLKITKRRRRQPLRDQETGQIIEHGVYKSQIVGVADQTVRFRAIADFQYSVNQQDPVVAVSEAVRKMDVSAIQNFQIPEPNEVITQDSFLPPPAFTRFSIPQIYDYRGALGTVPVEVTRNDRTYQRLFNIKRWKARPIPAITFDRHPPSVGPDGQLQPAQGELPVAPSDAELKGITGRGDPRNEREVFEHDATELKLLGLLAERPVWTRTALFNQLTDEERRQANNQKAILTAVSYTFQDGPWRDLVIRFGYDPRLDPNARYYQNIGFRNTANVRSKAHKIRYGPGQAPVESQFPEPTRSHIFDGVTVNSKIGNFQLCDVTDPLLRAHIDNVQACTATLESVDADGTQHWTWTRPEDDANDTDQGQNQTGSSCTRDNGWWHPAYLEQIRQILRRKFFGLLEGYTDIDCQDLLGDPMKFLDGAEAGNKTGTRAETAADEEEREASRGKRGTKSAGVGTGKRRGRPLGSTKASLEEKKGKGKGKQREDEDEDETSETGASSTPSLGGESGGDDIDMDALATAQRTTGTSRGGAIAMKTGPRSSSRRNVVASQLNSSRRSKRRRGPKVATEPEEKRAEKLSQMTRALKERRASRGSAGTGTSVSGGQSDAGEQQPSRAGSDISSQQAVEGDESDEDDLYS